MILNTDAGRVRSVCPVEDNLLVWRTRLAEHQGVVALVEVSPNTGQARRYVVILDIGATLETRKYLFATRGFLTFLYLIFTNPG